jgi:predicted transcriptional regulator
MKTISVKLPSSLADRLNRTVVKRGSTRSALVREAIEAQLAAEPAPMGASCFDLASDLAGAVDGPRDLSSNPGRLKRYGR